MFPADKHLTARQYPSLRAENRLDPRFKFMVFQRQTDGFRRDDMVTTVIRDIKIIFISRATDDLRMILKKISRQKVISLWMPSFHTAASFDVKLSLHCDFCTVRFL